MNFPAGLAIPIRPDYRRPEPSSRIISPHFPMVEAAPFFLRRLLFFPHPPMAPLLNTREKGLPTTL